MINEDRRIFRLEAEGTLEIAASLVNVSVFELEIARNKIGRSTQFQVAFTFQV